MIMTGMPPFTPNDIDKMDQANRRPLSNFMFTAGLIALGIVLAVVIWTVAT